MAKGENIFKRKDGRWEARYIKGYEVSGKIKYGFCYGKTYREAKEKVTQAKAALIVGKPMPVRSSRRRLEFYCDEWLKGTKNRVKESTYIKYEGLINNHIKPKLGFCYPLGMRTDVVDDFTLELLDTDKLAPKTVRDILGVLRSILKFTERQMQVSFPQIDITYPKEIKKEIRILSQEEQTQFIHYLLKDMNNCKFGILLAMNTGMRIGELCALRWNDISLSERTIHIHATMQRLRDTTDSGKGRTRVVIGKPKSETSVRTIPLTESMANLCKQYTIMESGDYILTGTQVYMEPRTLQYRFEKYTKECGLEGVHFHTLRHTFATRCVEVGFELKSLSEILGHASTTITLDRYTHPSMSLKRSNMTKLASVGL